MSLQFKEITILKPILNEIEVVEKSNLPKKDQERQINALESIIQPLLIWRGMYFEHLKNPEKKRLLEDANNMQKIVGKYFQNIIDTGVPPFPLGENLMIYKTELHREFIKLNNIKFPEF